MSTESLGARGFAGFYETKPSRPTTPSSGSTTYVPKPVRVQRPGEGSLYRKPQPRRVDRPGGKTVGKIKNPNDLGQNYDDLLDSAESNIGAGFDAEIEALKAKYGSQIAGTGGGDFGIGEILDELADIRGNRQAIKDVYAEYMDFTGGFGDEAVQAALAMIGEATPAFEQVHQETVEGYSEAAANAEGGIKDAGELIGAGEAAIVETQAKAIEDLELFQEQEEERRDMAASLLGLQSAAFKEQAEADAMLDKGQMTRQALLTDIEFGQMEEAAAQRLAAARRAAAAAAARRRALARERDAAIRSLQQQKYDSMKLNPHEAGTVAAMEYLKGKAADLDYNRQQLVVSTVENAISQQVPASHIRSYVRDQGVPMNSEEISLATNATRAYTNGMRFQQSRDRSDASPYGSTGKNFSRSPRRYGR